MNESTSTNYTSPLLNANRLQHTYRVQGIPLNYKRSKVQELLRSVLELDLGSMFASSHWLSVTTRRPEWLQVDFDTTPACLSLDRNQWSFEIPDDESGDAQYDDSDDDIIPKARIITIDIYFKGITVLRSFKNVLEHKIDCVAISGLGSHPFGSFKEKAGSHMWLRDSLPRDLPSARVMLYGYDTELENSQTLQDLEALASTFRLDLRALALATQDSSEVKPSVKPLIFIAHSLGGIVVKEAITQMKHDKDHLELLDSIYGALFFGVPNYGMDISSLTQMVKGQPNEALVHSLGKESQILRNQSRDFPKAFEYQGSSEIVCFYETETSPTIVLHGKEWKRTGPRIILVDSSSARHGRPWENEAHHCSALKRTHSALVKFSSHDGDYDRVLAELKRMASAAVDVIPRVAVPVEAPTYEAHLTLTGHSDCIRVMAFSPDGNQIASGSNDATVRLWNSTTDGKLLASGCKDGLIRLWDSATGKVRCTLKGHTNMVCSIAFSPDGKAVFSGSWDATVRLWDSGTGVMRWGKKGHADGVNSVAFSPNGKLLASGSKDGRIRFWDSATGATDLARGTYGASKGWINNVVFSPDGKVMAAASADHTIVLWNSTTSLINRVLKGHSDWVRNVAFSPDSEMVASASADHTVKLWDSATGVERHTLKGHSHWVSSVAFSPDGKLVASGSEDRTVRLWDSATGAALYTLKGHSGTVHMVAFSPDNKIVASTSQDATIRLWHSTVKK